MLRFFNPSSSPFPETRPVVTLGVFDGVHRGHQAILEATRTWARDEGVPAVALTFDIHPRKHFSRETAPRSITSLEHRLRLLESTGMDAACVLTFDDRLAGQSPEDFARHQIRELLRARGVVLGHDARFGRDRGGTPEALARLGSELGFEVRQVPPVRIGETVASSTAVREAVRDGRLDDAARILGRPVSVLGTVTGGRGLGRQLGFPTLNLDPHHELHPPRGVYVTSTRCGDTRWPSVTNIGHRPTVDADSAEDVLVETHLIEGGASLYGQVVEVSFFERLRDEKRFPDTEIMRRQIERDVLSARDYFARNPLQRT